MKEFLKDKDWLDLFNDEFQAPYMKNLESFLKNEYSSRSIYPKREEIFSAFNLTPFPKVKVVIIGQDPYHGPNQAHGLSFSVKKGVRIPPSLVNIFKELKNDLDIDPPLHGFLESWAKEGVLLLNNTLTVEAGKAASHKGKGWEKFTEKVIHYLNEKKSHLVFILWGSPAQEKEKFLDSSKHLIIKAPHPSPLSSYRGFFGSKPFSKANDFLISKNIEPINWKIT